LKLERVELFVVRLPLKHAYETSGSRETHQTRVIARVEADGVVGWGESVAPETPWYSGETPETVWFFDFRARGFKILYMVCPNRPKPKS